MKYIGKLDINKLGKYKDKIVTKDIILTNERELHIKENHFSEFDRIISNIANVVATPDKILEDLNNKDTIMFIGKLTPNNNLNVIVKLNITNSKEHPKNSIMTAWIIRDKNLIKLENKNKILYKRE